MSVEFAVPSTLAGLRARAEDVADGVVAPLAIDVDRDATWPATQMRALGDAGLLGLNAPRSVGGLGQGFLGLALVTEALARRCSSTALVYGMHCVGTAVLAAKARPEQEEAYLRPIAEGRHITSLALSEPGTGAHFYLPETTFRGTDDGYVLNGRKSFVTSGGEADSYVMSAVEEGRTLDPGAFTCFVVDRGSPGLEWQAPWQGFGMRGNSSRTADLVDVTVPRTSLLGETGDEIWYVFEVVAPYFLTAMSAAYLGIAAAAVDRSIGHVKGRRHQPSGVPLAENPIVSTRIGQMWRTVERSRRLLYHAATSADEGTPDAAASLMAAKADIAETAVAVTNEALTAVGGIGYGENSDVSRLLRDARAAHVMAPTTDMLLQWLGRSLLDLPIL